MKKSIITLGKALSKTAQKSITGGFNFTTPGMCDGAEGTIPFGCPCKSGWCSGGLICTSDTTMNTPVGYDGVCVYNEGN
ncbi:hypothetical protein ACFSTE_07235 [Aquimarina hainanensis]|uniref:Uncharacterized protein n=1 Tax=Aquimarina hainanensis TaxID=1578017 RepID=A0ABW5N5W0_9FLAO